MDSTIMNLFEKIQAVRVELANANLKMSGYNEYAKYDYFELQDFTKTLNEIMLKYKMTAIPSFTSDLATLTAINCENPDERFTITSPFSSASLKGCHEVQNIGAVETYQRRYLYQAMFDIAESDSLNALQGKKDEGSKGKAREEKKQDLPFPEQGKGEKQKSFEELKAQRQIELNELKTIYYPMLDSEKWTMVLKEISKGYGKKFSEMTEKEYQEVVDNIKNNKY